MEFFTMVVDSNVLIGHWAFRALPCRDPVSVRTLLEGAGINRAIAGSLAAVLYRNVQDGNEELYAALSKHRDFFLPAATINPAYAGWEKDFEQALGEKIAAVRVYPEYQGWKVLDRCALELWEACREEGLPVVFTTSIEDFRQRHLLDRPEEWFGGELRLLVEQTEELNLLVVNAGAEKVREIALTLPEERRRRVYFDTSGLWGPFVDDLALCIRQVGVSQFVFGTHSALKTPEAALTKLSLTGISEDEKKKIFSENIKRIIPGLSEES